MPVIYKVTYLNRKIYIGQDRTDDINYFGSASSALIAQDFDAAARQSFTVCREILWQSDNASRAEINAKELECILQYRSNDPAVGYNQWPRFRGIAGTENPSSLVSQP